MEDAKLLGIAAKVILGLFAMGGIGLCLYLAFKTVQQQTMAIIERFGKFQRAASPGLTIIIPFVDRIAGRPSLKVLETTISVETKTKDNVFVAVKVSVQYQIIQEKVVDAFYKLSNPEGQIKSYVFDVIRGQVPEQDLDDVFQSKDSIAEAVKTKLAPAMRPYGYEIVTVLVTDVDPDKRVKDAMNEINAATRMQVAATAKGEADKILVVKKAEAEKESKRLQGEGIALERLAIANGFKDSIQTLAGVEGTDSNEIMRMLMLTQHYDTLKGIGANAKSTVLLTPYTPGSVHDINSQIMDSLMLSKHVPVASTDKEVKEAFK